MKKILFLLIMSMVLGSTTGCVSYLRNSNLNVEIEQEEIETTKKLGNGKGDRARLAKDKTVVMELCYTIRYTLADVKYIEVKASGNAVAADENGEIDVSKLFDTSTDVGQAYVDELSSVMGLEEYKIKLTSDFNTECTLEIVEFDAKSGKAVIQLNAESYGIAFYADADGEHDGIYGHEN